MNNSKKKFTLTKLEFLQFDGDLKIMIPILESIWPDSYWWGIRRKQGILVQTALLTFRTGITPTSNMSTAQSNELWI